MHIEEFKNYETFCYYDDKSKITTCGIMLNNKLEPDGKGEFETIEYAYKYNEIKIYSNTFRTFYNYEQRQEKWPGLGIFKRLNNLIFNKELFDYVFSGKAVIVLKDAQ
jgi:hypothetical protein